MTNTGAILCEHGKKLKAILWNVKQLQDALHRHAERSHPQAVAVYMTEGLLLQRKMLEDALAEFKAGVLAPAGLKAAEVDFDYYKEMREKVL